MPRCSSTSVLTHHVRITLDISMQSRSQVALCYLPFVGYDDQGGGCLIGEYW